jgi:hypothetical protein
LGANSFSGGVILNGGAGPWRDLSTAGSHLVTGSVAAEGGARKLSNELLIAEATTPDSPFDLTFSGDILVGSKCGS